MKKLLLLGGSKYILPVIEEAHKQGIYVITCDYLPNNIAHKYSDEYCNVSIIEKEEVLKLAREKNIDGVMSFACDPGVTTAAYVAEKLGLPNVGPYESVCILQDKGLFRAFLKEHGFTVPCAESFDSIEKALEKKNTFNYPSIVKPVDSAGSKGVTRVDTPDELKNAIIYALENAHNGHFIIEDYIQQKGFSSDTDCFSIDGELVFASFDDQRFDTSAVNPYTPAAYSWPSTMAEEKQNELKNEIQRLIKLLNMKSAVYNVETRVGMDGKAYIMELSPRGGGNRLCEMLNYACGANLIRCAIQATVGNTIDKLSMPIYDGHYAEIILHSDKAGIFRGVEIAEEMKEKLIEKDIWVKAGEHVEAFTGANKTIGTLVLRFDTEAQLSARMANQTEWLKIITEAD